MKTYINPLDNTENVDTQLINSYFKDIKEHRDFVLNQADYQKHLEHIKHLTLEDELNP